MTIRDKEETVILEYNLYDLPTAQHKAGLAGLLLMIESMKLRKISPLPSIIEQTPTSVKIVFTREIMQYLFDDLYDGEWIEVESKTKWKNKEKIEIPPKKTIEKEIKKGDKIINQVFYIYDNVQPKGEFLKTIYRDSEGLWIKLWRDMIWNTLRGKPLTRLVYEDRANGNDCKLSSVFDVLKHSMENRKKSSIKTESLSGALYIGAESENAERTSFQGTIENNFLLHFWPLSIAIYIPYTYDRDGKSERKGYAIVVPEPSNLFDFIETTLRFFGSLDPVAYGIYPKKSVISVPSEGGLEYLSNIVKQDFSSSDLKHSISAVEIYHLEKVGNNIKIHSTERIIPRKKIIDKYFDVSEHSFNPLFRSHCIKNILSGKEWFVDMVSLFDSYPSKIFIKSDSTPSNLFFFGSDVRRKIRIIEEKTINMKGGNDMNNKITDDQLVSRIYRMMREYVHFKASKKSKIEYASFKDSKDEKGAIKYPKEYREALEKVCSEAFLAMRGRKEQDFVAYFIGTICSVPQFLPESEFVTLAKQVEEDWEKIKNLAMLSVSAHSYVWEPKIQNNKESKEE